MAADVKSEPLEQPDRFDLELELVRWVKLASGQTIPPVMVKPSGPITHHYGLDSKSRWREAVCVMMLVADPFISLEGTNKLGRQLAQLFRQDFQLWEVKARQLYNWVKRGLTNVKLLDRTLAYFQNQSSWLQYIKNLKSPIPEIETPGFPGTQWSEFYWKEQTVMLLMQEHDFPQGQSADFCARLFREEAGKWALKMDQFRRWLERGKSDPLPEYYGTGKNCPECGLFLWDARSFLKHMKRNHGVKIREREREKEMMFKDNSFSPSSLYITAEGSDSESSPRSEVSVLKSTKPTESLYILDSVKMEHEPPISTSSPLTSPSPVPPVASPSPQHPLPSPSTSKPLSSLSISLPNPSTSQPQPSPSKEPLLLSPSKDPHSLLNQTLPVRTAASRKEEPFMSKRERSKLVSCPECGFKCSHSKIVNHLMKCQKAHQANKPDLSTKSAEKPETKNIIPSTSSAQVAPDSLSEPKPSARAGAREKSPPNVSASGSDRASGSATSGADRASNSASGSGSSNIVKKVFWKKFEADRMTLEKSSKENSYSSPPYKSPDSMYRSPENRYRSPDHHYRSPDALYKSPDTLTQSPDTAGCGGSTSRTSSPDPAKPPLKLKLSRKEGSQEKPCFEINKPIISSLLRQNFLRFSPTPPRDSGTPPPSAATPPPPPATVATHPANEESISSTTLSIRIKKDLTKDNNGSKGSNGSRSAVSEECQPPAACDSQQESIAQKIKIIPPVNPAPMKSSLGKAKTKSQKSKSAKDDEKKTIVAAETKTEKPSTSAAIEPPTVPDTVAPSESPLNTSGGGSEGTDESRRSRRGKMLSCPLCGAEYAIASNLEKHIDRDHAEPPPPRQSKKRGAARKAPTAAEVTPPKKVRKFRSDTWTDVTAEAAETTSPILITPDLHVSPQETKDLASPVKSHDKPEENPPETETRKLTEYEIFQNLQMKASKKPERRKVSCDKCEKQIPPNNLKRHMERHAKLESGEIAATPKAKGKASNLVQCDRCEKEMPKNTIKRHILKHKRLDKEVADDEEVADKDEEPEDQEDDNDDRIPCEECGKRLPKNAMKRHMMKHEVDNLDCCGDTEPNVELIIKKEVDSESAEESVDISQDIQEKKGKERKKISCDKCGLQCAPNTFRRHLEKHRREDPMEGEGENYAPIEITPKKEYWEMQGEETANPAKANLLQSKTDPPQGKMDPAEESQAEAEDEADNEQLVFVKDTKPKTKDAAKDGGEKGQGSKSKEEDNVKEGVKSLDKGSCKIQENKLEKIVNKLNKNIKVVQEQEKGKAVSGSEEEGENPLELAVRKVVSYKMTPKQALSIYNLTPKVLFDNLLGETDEDRMAILQEVDLSKEGEEKIIDFCRRHEAQLSYKSVINHVKELKHKSGKTEFNLSRLQAYRWWYAFRKKYDLKITAKKK